MIHPARIIAHGWRRHRAALPDVGLAAAMARKDEDVTQ
jgi:hypothetical protein